MWGEISLLFCSGKESLTVLWYRVKVETALLREIRTSRSGMKLMNIQVEDPKNGGSERGLDVRCVPDVFAC